MGVWNDETQKIDDLPEEDEDGDDPSHPVWRHCCGDINGLGKDK